ncbi:hypothetical protein [Halalkalibacillus halophilus]|nr:hypothetical protein [Halalkalibacillus halophilus]
MYEKEEKLFVEFEAQLGRDLCSEEKELIDWMIHEKETVYTIK